MTLLLTGRGRIGGERCRGLHRAPSLLALVVLVVWCKDGVEGHDLTVTGDAGEGVLKESVAGNSDARGPLRWR